MNPKLYYSMPHQIATQNEENKGYVYSFDSSRTKIGKQMTRNWIGKAIGEITITWSDRLLSKDLVRVLLKKSFYKS